ncbi:MAG: hypothetical protein U9Q99_02710 [Nanoarchaeota archaeon]|nr:hypothetical protein [Nanoarchaeota archaeon]
MTEKVLIFDASSLISIAMNGLLPKLEKLKEISNAKFIIPKEVHYEIIKRPLNIKKFELEALQLNLLVKKGILELPNSLGIKDSEITSKTKKIMNLANKTFFENNQKEIHLIDLGESACLALGKILNEKQIENVLVIDERTTRILCEKPENLRKLMQKKLHRTINFKKENLSHFKNFKITRSCELMYLAYKKGFFEITNKKIVDAFLYALRFKGCSISTEEIKEIKKMR